MKIMVFNGSPRAEKGNTHFMVEAFLKGAQGAGAETENIFLAKKNIKPCLGCFCCWVKTPGECVIKDDMAELRSQYTAADIVVYATPLYVDNVTGIMKNFMDRLVPLADPYFEKDENGQYRHVKAGKEVVQNMRLSEATREELEKPLIPHDMYIKGANKDWDRQLKAIAQKK